MSRPIHNNSITIAKAIGIILMVIGHSGCPQFVNNLIYLFHMPLFFFCSGIFFTEMTTNESVFLYLKKKFRGLYVPFVKWSILFLLLHNLLLGVGIYNHSYGYEGGASYYKVYEMSQRLFLILFTMHGYEDLLGGFWFIRALFISSLLIAFVSIVLKTKPRYKYELECLLFLVMTILIRRIVPDPEYWRDISMGALGAMFYMAGFLLKQYDSVWKNKKGAVICCIPLLFSLYHFKDGVAMGCGYNKVLLFSISAISGSMLILYISKLIEDIDTMPLIKNSLYYIGNHTLDILALHFLSFKIVSYLIVLLYGFDIAHIAEHPVIKIASAINSYWWILYTMVGILVPLLINRIWQVIVIKFEH